MKFNKIAAGAGLVSLLFANGCTTEDQRVLGAAMGMGAPYSADPRAGQAMSFGAGVLVSSANADAQKTTVNVYNGDQKNQILNNNKIQEEEKPRQINQLYFNYAFFWVDKNRNGKYDWQKEKVWGPTCTGPSIYGRNGRIGFFLAKKSYPDNDYKIILRDERGGVSETVSGHIDFVEIGSRGANYTIPESINIQNIRIKGKDGEGDVVPRGIRSFTVEFYVDDSDHPILKQDVKIDFDYDYGKK